MMALSSALSIILLICRIQWTGYLYFIFLPWNLFLAWIPFCCALAIRELKAGASRWLIACLFCCWLVFFPNSPYILTDLFHLRPKQDVPLWFDLVLILSFAWNGLFLGYTSLFMIHRFLEKLFSKRTVWLFISGIMLLCGFGIYLGRYPRWNSWDVITSPIALMRDISGMMLHPLDHPRMLGVTFFFSLFLMMSYVTLITFIQNLQHERK